MDITDGLVWVDGIAGDGLQQNKILKCCYRNDEMNKLLYSSAMIFVGQYPRPLHFLQTFSRRGFSLSQSS